MKRKSHLITIGCITAITLAGTLTAWGERPKDPPRSGPVTQSTTTARTRTSANRAFICPLCGGFIKHEAGCRFAVKSDRSNALSKQERNKNTPADTKANPRTSTTANPKVKSAPTSLKTRH